MKKRSPILRVTVPVQNVRFPSRCVDCDGPEETTCMLHRKIGRKRILIPAPACRNCAAWRKKTRFAWYGGWALLTIFFVVYAFSGEATGFWEQSGLAILAELAAFALVQVWFLHYAEENLYHSVFHRVWAERFTVTSSDRVDVTLAIRDIALRDDIARLSADATHDDAGERDARIPPVEQV